MNIKSKKFLAAVAVVALLGYIFGWSSLLEVRTITVTGIEGSKTLTEKKVIKKSGITPGAKLARVNSGTVARALREYPEVARVEIHRKPLHTLEIALQLRSIDVAIAIGNGKYALGDISGVTFIEVTEPPKGIPVINGDRRYLQDAMTIYEALPKKIRKKVAAISLPSRGSITLSLRSGLSILWGSATEQEAKLTVLAALLAAPENKRARFIDIATPLTPTVK